MQDRVYINGQLITPTPSIDDIRQAVEAGKLVVAVDGGGVPVQITKEILAQAPPQSAPQ